MKQAKEFIANGVLLRIWNKKHFLVDGTQQFTAVDNNGYPRPDATWSLPNRTTLASITSDSSPVLTAKAVGQVVLTATVQGITSQTTVNIVSTVGSSNWSVPPLPGFSAGVTTMGRFAPAVPSDNAVGAFSVETSSTGAAVRGLSADGRQLWQQPLSMSAVAPDLAGGLLIGADARGGLTDLDGLTGSPLWSTSIQGGEIAVRSDGSVVGITGNSIYGPLQVFIVNGATGQSTLIPIADMKTSTTTYAATDGCRSSGPTTATGAPLASTIFTADTDGNAYIEYVVQTSQETVVIGSDTCTELADYATGTDRLVLMTITPDGSASTRDLTSRSFTTASGSAQSGSGSFILPGSITPDGQGGVLATWNELPSYASSAYMVSHLSATGQSDFRLPALDNMSVNGPTGALLATVVLGGDGTGYVYSGIDSNTPYTIVAFNTNSGQQLWATQAGIGVNQMFAQDGGGVIVQGPDMANNTKVLAIDSTGTVGAATGTGQLLTDSWGGTQLARAEFLRLIFRWLWIPGAFGPRHLATRQETCSGFRGAVVCFNRSVATPHA